MLAVLGGNASPSADDIKKILKSVDAEVEEEVLTRVMTALSGKDVFEVIEQGKEKLASVPSGGGVAAPGAAAGGAPAAEEEKKEESEEESEEDEGMEGFDLFD